MTDSFLYKKVLAEYNVSVTQSILLRVFTDVIFLRSIWYKKLLETHKLQVAVQDWLATWDNLASQLISQLFLAQLKYVTECE